MNNQLIINNALNKVCDLEDHNLLDYRKEVSTSMASPFIKKPVLDAIDRRLNRKVFISDSIVELGEIVEGEI